MKMWNGIEMFMPQKAAFHFCSDASENFGCGAIWEAHYDWQRKVYGKQLKLLD